ncbi:hypothetical protein G6F37_008221 [Rhizopus arrhizus]|nr:hypothetical protein G6F38_008493 [Rhizopus arrhizus]KAG1155785.1 hypothetical protein G6F37_008221 [Rhizopus arrhizus]
MGRPRKAEPEEYEVERIVEHRVIGKTKKKIEYFIKWKGYSTKHNTWEPASAFFNAKSIVQKYWDHHGGIEERDRLLSKKADLPAKKEIISKKTARKASVPEISNKKKRVAVSSWEKAQAITKDIGKEIETTVNDDDEEIDYQSKMDTIAIDEHDSAINLAVDEQPALNEKLELSKEREVLDNEISEEEKRLEYLKRSSSRLLQISPKDEVDSDEYDESDVIIEPGYREDWDWSKDVLELVKVHKGNAGELEGLIRWKDGMLTIYPTRYIKEKYPKLVVLVTGGSRGIGEMIATGFVAAGAKVYITSRSADVCYKVAKELSSKGPGQCIAIPADLQSKEEIKRLVGEISKAEDHLDVLINNAGANWNEPFESFSDEAFEKVINLNLKRIFTLTQACLPLLTVKTTQLNTSSVINIGSIDGERSPPQETYAYSASKSGLHHLSRHMAGRLGQKNVRVNVIAPGAFQSKMMKATLEKFHDQIVSGIPVGRIGSPEDIAGTCIYLSSRAGQYTNGATVTVDGGALVGSKI